jgi:hypothetical protein
MKKLVKTGDPEVTNYLETIFAKTSVAWPKELSYKNNDPGYFACLTSCGFICPDMYEEFEVLEEIEFPDDKILIPGIYRISHHSGGNTSHFIHIEKYENGGWKRHLCAHAGWSNEVMVNWIGIKRIRVQSELQF